MPNEPCVAIIIVNWNRYNDTVDCLESIRKISYKKYYVVIVDNGSSDASGRRLRERYPECVLIQNENNAGFAGGINAGLKYALERGTDYALILNNDTEVAENFLGELVKAGASADDIGIVGAKIYHFDDRKKVWSFGGYFDVNTGRARHLFSEEEAGKNYKKPKYLYAPGCSMLIKRECVDKAGLFSEKFFHLGEDVEYCIRAQNNGWKLAFAPNAAVYHKASSSMKFLNPAYNYYEQRNRLYIIKEYNTYKNILEFWKDLFVISLRILYVIIFMTEKKKLFLNIRYIYIGIRDFLKNRTGRRF